MKLRELLQAIPELDPSAIAALPGAAAALDAEVKGLSPNSATCQVGDLFFGMPGTRVDGGEFWPSAVAAGAIAAIVSPDAAAKVAPSTDPSACVIVVPDVRSACGQIARAFFGQPTDSLAAIGVTGTNGKTTTTHLIEYCLQAAERPSALLGTLYARWPGFEQVATHTTPFAIDLQSQLASARDAGATACIMEVSSHALDQKRVLGCEFEVAVFTNLTQDHLDYHESMDAYFEAKAKLFAPPYFSPTGRAIVNADSDYGQILVERLGDRAWTYSLENPEADFYASDLTLTPTGASGQLETPAGTLSFSLPLVGRYNLENMMAAVGAALAVGLDLEVVVNALPKFAGVPGRMERVEVESGQDGQTISTIVDYAHTPDSLENALKAFRPFVTGRTICVFGCGGDRDRTKRPLMGKIAAELADLAVVTSDNPRTEDPQQILDDVIAGIPGDANAIVEADRATAIRRAILEAEPGDGVLIAGKGHEDYQILGTEKIHFDDREQARAALALRDTP
ncbi:MAG: UDP-N-acetylmuramoyl-L-alanyl-D-glutamate--2,6-diaminopimelate ligase [Geitlerinemataceae cyanobacterium]